MNIESLGIEKMSLDAITGADKMAQVDLVSVGGTNPNVAALAMAIMSQEPPERSVQTMLGKNNSIGRC